VGPGAPTEVVGTEVIAVTSAPQGGMADMVSVPVTALWPAGPGMSPAKAAALPVVYQTGWFGLYRRAHLEAGETLLVHAGAGGVGSAAIQLGKAAGARVIATAGGPEKVNVCRSLGADVAVDYLAGDFVDVVKAETRGRGADVIYDPVGGDVFDRSRSCIAWEGRLVVIGFTSGRIPEAPANHVLLKNYAVVGLHWGQYIRRHPDLVARAHADLLDLFAQGRIDPLVSAEYPMEAAPAALERLGNRATWGKVVIRP
ncbi:MAG TPA: NADPH:quinone oxidoreductase family protein, partial [Acidimicrobiales bacterium]|nr:NADPH:quinone oxidoreductase family protein [Acidimicrobiales bacterium]